MVYLILNILMHQSFNSSVVFVVRSSIAKVIEYYNYYCISYHYSDC